MRKLCTIALVAMATVVVTAITGSSAYAGEAATTGFVRHHVVVELSGANSDQDLGGCRSHVKNPAAASKG